MLEPELSQAAPTGTDSPAPSASSPGDPPRPRPPRGQYDPIIAGRIYGLIARHGYSYPKASVLGRLGAARARIWYRTFPEFVAGVQQARAQYDARRRRCHLTLNELLNS